MPTAEQEHAGRHLRPTRRRRPTSALAVVAMLLPLLIAPAAIAGCARDDAAEPRREKGDTTTAANDSIHAGGLSDPQVATLMSQLDGAEVSAAQVALKKVAGAPARDFARAMLAEHAAMDSARKLLPLRTDTMTQPPPQVATMQAAATAQGAMLDGIPAGPAFDRAYLASQVVSHGQAIDSLRKWRQSATNPLLQRAIDEAIPRVDRHLQRARLLQESLGDGSATASPPGRPALTPEPAETPVTPLGRATPDTASPRAR